MIKNLNLQVKCWIQMEFNFTDVNTVHVIMTGKNLP